MLADGCRLQEDKKDIFPVENIARVCAVSDNEQIVEQKQPVDDKY
jgi:hypothetical protein